MHYTSVAFILSRVSGSSNVLLDTYKINILKVYDGVLWLEMKHMYDDVTIFPCVCYLPPEHFFWHADANIFYNNLLQDVYELQNKGLIGICGDLNSRCGNNDDFIAGIDNIVHRDVVDFASNSCGYILIQFLIDSSMCMLNGRNFVHNDYTSVSTKECAVVDYCLVTHENLQYFSDFNVHNTLDLLKTIGV